MVDGVFWLFGGCFGFSLCFFSLLAVLEGGGGGAELFLLRFGEALGVASSHHFEQHTWWQSPHHPLHLSQLSFHSSAR